MSRPPSHTESEGEDLIIIGTARPKGAMETQAPGDSDRATQPDAQGSQQSNRPRTPRILVLTGLVGSGKSTFVDSLCKYYPDQYKRASQDVLGSRQAVESYVMKQLRQGYDICIDRTNVDAPQRAHWLKLAKHFQDSSPTTSGPVAVEVYSLFFNTPYEACKARLEARTSHETLHSPSEAVKVLNIFSRQLKPPADEEGFHKTITVRPDWCAGPEGASQAEVDAVMAILQQAPYAPTFSTGQPTKGALAEAKAPARRSHPYAPPPRPGRGYYHNPSSASQRGDGRRRSPVRTVWQTTSPWTNSNSSLPPRPPNDYRAQHTTSVDDRRGPYEHMFPSTTDTATSYGHRSKQVPPPLNSPTAKFSHDARYRGGPG